MKFFFDLTTSARWSGHVVGIVRVERELAKRARAYLPGVQYCAYDRAAGTFVALKPEVVHDVLHGRATVRFDPVQSAGPAPLPMRRRLRNAVMSRPRAYQLFQRLRGRRFTLAEIAGVRAAELEAEGRGQKEDKGVVIPLSEAVVPGVEIGRDAVVISGGLDWEYKDLRKIFTIRKQTGLKYVAIVYDIIPIILPQYVVASYIDLLIDYFGELFWGVDCVMAISAQSKSDMLAYCARSGLPAPVADHFPLGADLSGQLGAEASLPVVLEGKRYAIYVSTIEPRKNHRLLYEAWDYCLRYGMVDRERDRLVFVGRPGWNVGDLMHEMTVNPNTADTIVILSDVPDAELARLYREAAFGLFPSLYEGYGLPLAEMLSLGKACLSSRSGSLEEVGKDLVVYIDPIDRIEWAKNIAHFFKDQAAVARAEERIRKEYRIVTWDASAEEFFGKVHKMIEPGVASPPFA